MFLKFLYILAFAMPFIGMINMESGEYGGSIGEFGYRNFVSEAFLFFSLIAYASYKCLGLLISNQSESPSNLHSPSLKQFRRSIYTSALVVFCASFAMIFLFGGINTIIGNIDRGQFRANLGAFGAAAYFMLKFLVPGILSGIVLGAQNIKIKIQDYIVISVVFIFAALVSLSFGFKSGLITMVLPALVLSVRKITFKFLIISAFCVFIVIYSSYFIFESLDDMSSEIILGLFVDRLTTVQGAVPWKLWTMLINGEAFPSYSYTLLAIFGDTFLTLATGVSANSNPNEWVLMHSALIPTLLSGYSAQEIVDGHNNTATAFSEGIIFGGFFGIVFFGVLCGLLIRFSLFLIDRSIYKHNYAASATAACFSIHCVWAWIMSGGINMVFHISIIFNLSVLYIILRFIFNYGSHKNSIY